MNKGNVKKNKREDNCRIAVIGIGCTYPGAKTPLQFWENILARRQQFREMPEERLPADEYHDIDPTAEDKSYQNKAAVIDGYSFDWLNKRIPKSAYESTDIVHWLALDTAIQAVKDSGLKFDENTKAKAGVILGNTLTGEFTRSNNMRLRWPYVKKALNASLKKKGLDSIQEELESVMEKYYKSVFPDITEDSLAGGLANTIAGRVCNYMDLHGGGYIVDGACSSSLLAITNAANALEMGQMDIAIAGGVDVSLDTFELIGFAKTGALTKNEMRVYDKRGNGFIPGEGCGIVVLKRLEDAKRDNDTIYATIEGWGISSDGKGGITAPNAIGQSMALKRAHQKAGINPKEITFIEGHGTGTTVGDRIELEGISIALGSSETTSSRFCGVTSLKSIIGHTKAAAGIGAFIKTVIALNRRVLPPTAGIQELNPIFNDKANAIYPILNGKVMNADSKLYAGVSAMGFGGINSHVLLKSGNKPQDKLQPELDENLIIASKQTHEVVIFSAANKEDLLELIKTASQDAKGISIAELADFATQNNSKQNQELAYRASVVYSSPVELTTKLNTLEKYVSEGNLEEYSSAENDTICWGLKKDNLRVGGLFPGQGSQRVNMSSSIVNRFSWTKNLISLADNIYKSENKTKLSEFIFKTEERAKNEEEVNIWKNELKQTNTAQPAITLASLIWKKRLENLGLNLSSVTGHSLGELSSFHAAGFMNEETMLNFATFRGKQMSVHGSGTMASLVCSKETVEDLIMSTAGYAVIANINSPEQIVISGEEKAIDAIVEQAEKKQIRAIKLPVSAAFHSKLIGDTEKLIKNFAPLKSKNKKHSNISIISSVTGKHVEDGVNLNSYFSEQSTSQVNFIEAINTMKDECDVMVEIGPGRVLSGLASSIQDKVKCFPIDVRTNQNDSLHIMLANLFVMGMNINVPELYKNRLLRDFVPVRDKEFLVNPCERPFPEIDVENTSSGLGISASGLLPHLNIPESNANDYWSKRSNFIEDIIRSDMKHFSSNGNHPIQKETGNTVTVAKNEQVIAKDSSDNNSVESIIYDEIQKLTGFPKESYTESMKLLDDFNLDSIKAGTLLNSIIKSFNLQGKIVAGNFANASIGNIIAEVNKYYTPAISKPNSKATAETEDVDNVVKELISAKTGFPADQLNPEFRLLEDLNLDSIKAGTLINELIKKYNLQGKVESAGHANSSINEIIASIKSFTNTAEKDVSNTEVNQVRSIQDVFFEQIESKTGFPVQELKPGFRLLDDLNLDSIKAGTVLTTLFKEYNVVGKIEASKYANASLSEIIEAVETNIKNPPVLKKDNAEQNALQFPIVSYSVHSKTLEPIQKDKTTENYWESRNVALVGLDKKFSINNQLIKDLKSKVSFVQYYTVSELQKSDINFNNLVVILPKDQEKVSLEKVVQLFSSIANYTANKDIDLGFLQFNDGYFGKNSFKKSFLKNIYSAAGYASSMHLERPNSKICVVEYSVSLNDSFVGQSFLDEVSQQEVFNMIGYNKNKNRVQLEYDLSYDYISPRSTKKITDKDVFLITGGAKGITAECGLAMARKYKCKVALIGSSAYKGKDGEIKDTLGKYADFGLTAEYFSCNISDLESTQELVKKVKAKFGKITGIVHGAGKNTPRRSETVDFESAIDEISPKVKGVQNLYNSVGSEDLKYFIALTSIIGVTGMAGNSWYAFSNELLDLYLRQINISTNIETVALAYSVWSEVGMGERMGSTKALSNMGIGAIPPEKGVEEFIRWIDNKCNDQQIVIASKIGGLDTWRLKSPEVEETGRYMEKIIDFNPGNNLKVRADLNEKTDLYTSDHDYKGSLLFPTVFGLEAMTQAVALLTGNKSFSSLTLENISLMRPIVVPKDGSTEIEINAVNIDPENSDSSLKRIKVGISTESSNFSEDHFSAQFVLGISNKEDIKVSPKKYKEPLAIDPKSDLYSWLLFQGPRFQLIDKVFEVNNSKATFKTKTPGTDGSDSCFPKDKTQEFVLGNPLLRDTLLQSVQLSLTKQQVLPIGIEKWEFFNIAEQTKGGEVRCELVNWDEINGVCDVAYVNENNEVIERIQGYKVKAMEPTETYPVSDYLGDLSSGLKTKLSDELSRYKSLIEPIPEILIDKFSTDFHQLKQNQRRDIESITLENHLRSNSKLSLDAKINKIKWAENGKPSIKNSDVNISISHCQSILFMTLGKDQQGCDIEKIEPRDRQEWNDLFNSKYSNTINQMMNEGMDINLDRSCSRLWSMREACIKAHGFIPAKMSIIKKQGNAIFFETEHNNEKIQALTFPIDFLPNNSYMAAFLVNVSTDTTKEPEVKLLDIDNIYDPKSKKFVNHFYTSFKECRTFHGKTYFANFPHWMGSLREYILTPVKEKLLQDLGSGEYGMVTNDSTINIYGQASTLDKITGKLWITDKSNLKNSLIDLAYEWYKHTDDGKLEKLADCVLSTTWVKIEDRGIVKISPIPSYFYNFLESHQKNDKIELELTNDKKNLPQAGDLGELLYKSSSIPRPEILLNKKVYQTGISNSNTVGNLYYSNYYDWQAKNIESYFYKLDPEIYLQNGKLGEHICIKSNTIHLQEAMPFEEIEVRMYLQEMYACGMELYFEFYSVENNVSKKLAYGNHTLIWAKRENENALPKAYGLPESIIKQYTKVEVS